MALKHHWKFSNNLQDSVGDLHLTNVVGTIAYTANKDLISNTALDCSVDFRAYSNNTTELGEAQRSYSLWAKKNLSTNSQTLYMDRVFKIVMDNSSNGIFLYFKSGNYIDYTYESISYTGLSAIVSENEWFNLIITNNNDGAKKIFINGVLVNYRVTTITPSVTGYPVHIGITPFNDIGSSYQNRTNIDEIKYFDHILTDGGITTIGQPASLDSEVWQLYISGVNNIPAYTLNPATDITGTSARLNWNES